MLGRERRKKQHWERLSVREKERQCENIPCKFRRWKRRGAEHLSGPDRARLATRGIWRPTQGADRPEDPQTSAYAR